MKSHPASVYRLPMFAHLSNFSERLRSPLSSDKSGDSHESEWAISGVFPQQAMQCRYRRATVFPHP
ncbi:hypothetical protein [Novipirellula maiorica]|nr:hypothetical protein [Rhodopirellula maiorica]